MHIIVIHSLTFLAVTSYAADAAKPEVPTVPQYSSSSKSIDVEALKKAVELGDSQAMVDLGVAYFDGTGVSQNYQLAEELLTRAFKLGNASGAYNIGILHASGAYGMPDSAVACDWFISTVELDSNYEIAYNNVADCYAHGEGRRKDAKKAVYWYQKAAATEDPIALCNLAKYYALGDGGLKRDRNKAKQLCRTGYELGEPTFCSGIWEQFNLGR